VFFIVSKILSYLLNPLFWILAILVIAFIIRNKRLSRRLLLISIILFYLFSNRFICDKVISCLEMPMTPGSELADIYDVGIVLGGNTVNYDKKHNRWIFRDNTDRIFQTLELYKKGKIKNILLSGGPGDLFLKDKYEAAFLRDWLVEIGIPDSIIIVDSVSRNTHENAENTSVIINRYFQDGDYLLITSAYHMKRATGCFEKLGIEVTPYPTGKLTGKRKVNFEYLFVPQLISFERWKIIIHESVGFIVYRIAGYI